MSGAGRLSHSRYIVIYILLSLARGCERLCRVCRTGQILLDPPGNMRKLMVQDWDKICVEISMTWTVGVDDKSKVWKHVTRYSDG